MLNGHSDPATTAWAKPAGERDWADRQLRAFEPQEPGGMTNEEFAWHCNRLAQAMQQAMDTLLRDLWE